MAYINNKILYVYNDEGVAVPFATVLNEIVLTSDTISRDRGMREKYKNAVLSSSSIRVVGVYICNDDWSIRYDASEDVTACSYDDKYESGQVRNASISLFNNDGKWNPNPVKGMHWKGTKVKLDVGIFYDGTVFWKHCGLFGVSNASLPESQRIVSLSLCDKYGFLNGTIGGKSSGSLQIPSGTSVYEAAKACLSIKKENGQVYDDFPIIFPQKYLSAKTPYTISKTPNYSIGDILQDLGKMVFCDVYYNEYGYLVFEDAIEDATYDENTVAVSWMYLDDDLSYSDASIDIDYSSIINTVVVKGAIENGKQYSGTAINDNPKSQTNIQLTEPNVEEMEDGNIIGDANCFNRAKYELKNKSLLSFSIKYNSIFLPHLNSRNIVKWSSCYHNIKNACLLITSINVDALSGLMNITAVNVNEVVL